MIIDGYRPSLDVLPNDIPPCIIEIIKHCWNSKPSSRPSLGKIISILTIILQLDIIKYSLQLSSALLFLYNHDIVHLDLKSDNLMISHNDDLIIVDFGLAGIMDPNGQVQYSQTHGGNSFHLSPEVLSAIVGKYDLPCKNQHSWELGMIMFEMFSKRKTSF